MNISTILDHIDTGYMALPEFQRGYVWNRDQVRNLFQSLYRKHPIGSLLVWVTESEAAEYRGGGSLAPGVVKLLLDGQQRITSVYGIVRGSPPKFFDGNSKAFEGLHFHLDTEEFSFYMPIKMKDDPLWVDITRLMQDGLPPFIESLSSEPSVQPKFAEYISRMANIIGIKETKLHVEEVTGKDKTIDIVVDIFNRANSGGTKLSQGDLALAKICAELPAAREKMKNLVKKWKNAGYYFDLDWLLRNINTIATGEAKFIAMHDISASQFEDGINRAEKAIDHLLFLISGRLGLDHDRVLFGKYAFPVMAHYLNRRGGRLDDETERDKLIFWYLHSALWGRFSGSTETFINKDLQAIEDLDGGLERLIRELRLWRGGLNVEPEHFGGWSLGARFYPMLYLLTRIGEARDWGNGIPLKARALGSGHQLEVHHIFPRSLLYKNGYDKSEVNAVANYCFLTKDTNLQISNRSPEVYFEKIKGKYPGALESQWIPMDKNLWKIENYMEFLNVRKALLAKAANELFRDLYHGDDWERELTEEIDEGVVQVPIETEPIAKPIGGIESEKEQQLLNECNEWVMKQGLPEGRMSYELNDLETGRPLAIFDLAWPEGLQRQFSQPVAVLIGEGEEVHSIANSHGYRYFTSLDTFKEYILKEILVIDVAV